MGLHWGVLSGLLRGILGVSTIADLGFRVRGNFGPRQLLRVKGLGQIYGTLNTTPVRQREGCWEAHIA